MENDVYIFSALFRPYSFCLIPHSSYPLRFWSSHYFHSLSLLSSNRIVIFTFNLAPPPPNLHALNISSHSFIYPTTQTILMPQTTQFLNSSTLPAVESQHQSEMNGRLPEVGEVLLADLSLTPHPGRPPTRLRCVYILPLSARDKEVADFEECVACLVVSALQVESFVNKTNFIHLAVQRETSMDQVEGPKIHD